MVIQTATHRISTDLLPTWPVCPRPIPSLVAVDVANGDWRDNDDAHITVLVRIDDPFLPPLDQIQDLVFFKSPFLEHIRTISIDYNISIHDQNFQLVPIALVSTNPSVHSIYPIPDPTEVETC